MLNEAKKMVKLVDEMMEVCNGLFDLSVLGNMDDDEFNMIKLYMKAIDLSKEYMLKQAEVMDKQTEKLDLILSKLEEKES